MIYHLIRASRIRPEGITDSMFRIPDSGEDAIWKRAREHMRATTGDPEVTCWHILATGEYAELPLIA